MIQPHFYYTCSAWYPNVTQKLKKKLQVMQNKCIHFCLQLDKMSTISHKEFKLVITWFEQSVISVVFKFINDSCQYYLDEVIEFAPKGNIILRNNFLNNIFEIQTLVKKSLIFYWSFVLQSNPRDLKENRQLKYI